jgi:hypothetical protein
MPWTRKVIAVTNVTMMRAQARMGPTTAGEPLPERSRLANIAGAAL